MPRPSDSSYFLPLVFALQAGKILSTGRTQPMIVVGVCQQSGEKGEYVVKLKGSPEMFPGSALKELVAALIGMELNLPVVEPAIIEVSEDFVQSMRDNNHPNLELANLSLGFNFGSTYNKGFIEITPDQPLDEMLQHKLAELFAFDIFINNPDRRIDKNNFATNGKELLIYDHEMAFSFIHELAFFSKNPNPWIIIESDMTWISNNWCFNRLKRKIFDFSNFAAKLDVINEQFWNKVQSIIPEEWMNDQFGAIKQRLSLIVNNKGTFAEELKRILS